MELIEIFKAGTRKDANGVEVTISRDDLQAVVDNYTPAFHEAPLVVGHPKMDAPAYGWAEELVLEGDVLKAKPKQVDASFAEAVRSGKFKKISAAFYRPNSPSNPKPENWYLRHIGFLGAMPPAVKGLADPVFNDNAEDVVVFGETFQPPTDDNPEGETMSPEDKQKMAELEAENARLKAEQAQAKKDAAAKENAEFAESLVAEGKLTPKQKEDAVALLNADFDSAEFGEADFKGNLKAFLSGLPKSIEFAETAKKDNAATAEDDSVQYAEGTDPASIEADKKVRAYMQEHKVSYTAAFNQIYNA